jgi:hypothetical protein
MTPKLETIMDPKSLWAGIPRPAKIYLAAVGALAAATVAVVAGVATVAAATSPSPSPSAGRGAQAAASCNTFTNHLATDLGKSQSQVQKAIAQAIGQTLDDAVKNGDLTQKQADAIKAKVGSNACAAGAARVPGIAGGRPFGPFSGGGPLARIAAGGLNEYAKALGISQTELQQDLQSGKTIKDIAASKGLDENAFRGKLVGATKTDLDAQVKAGNLTQKQEDAVIQRLQNGPLPLWDRTVMPRHRFGPGPAPSPTGSASPSTSG